ncbi:MAG: ECF transporter S component [Ruminococcaceae bacterium]|nr:ECF transporter S component [Oscillospiraceae bacterium]
MKTRTQRLVTAALLASLCCIATMIIKIPSPLKGYLNIGDSIVLVTGWLLSPTYGFFAAGLGSALADIFVGYALYAPATFIIKGLMAIIAYYGCKIISKKIPKTLSRIVAGSIGEIAMVLGYFVFEGFVYGFGPALINIPANAVQGIAGLILSVVFIKVFEKNNKWR